jgi:hypothetical protein
MPAADMTGEIKSVNRHRSDVGYPAPALGRHSRESDRRRTIENGMIAMQRRDRSAPRVIMEYR